jgi:hydrogenase nickel insertion protein HypA
MHEVGVAGEIIKTAKRIARENGAEKPGKVGLSVGTLSGVEPNSLGFALEAIKSEFELSETVFEIKVIKAEGICAECGKSSQPDAFFALCPHCNSPALELINGTEFKIEFIDI